MSSFRFQARYALLTYAQCGDLDAFVVSDHLSSLGGECIIGRENHADEGIHLHAFVDFGSKFSTRDVRVFDVQGHHPNVEPSRGRPAGGYDYAIKDGDVVAGGLERPKDPGGVGVSKTTEKWSTIVSAQTRDEFWALLAELDPSAMVRSFTQCRAYADHRYRETRDSYVTPDSISIDTGHVDGLDEWVVSNIVGHRRGGMYLWAFFS